jgi:hypothetical protein
MLWKSTPGRPPIPLDLQALICRMARENPTWGEERIANELLLKHGSTCPNAWTPVEGNVCRRNAGGPLCALMPRLLSPVISASSSWHARQQSQEDCHGLHNRILPQPVIVSRAAASLDTTQATWASLTCTQTPH